MQKVSCILCMEDLDVSYDSYAVSTEGVARAVLPRRVSVIVAKGTHLSGVSQLRIDIKEGLVRGRLSRVEQAKA